MKTDLEERDNNPYMSMYIRKFIFAVLLMSAVSVTGCGLLNKEKKEEPVQTTEAVEPETAGRIEEPTEPEPVAETKGSTASLDVGNTSSQANNNENAIQETEETSVSLEETTKKGPFKSLLLDDSIENFARMQNTQYPMDKLADIEERLFSLEGVTLLNMSACNKIRDWLAQKPEEEAQGVIDECIPLESLFTEEEINVYYGYLESEIYRYEYIVSGESREEYIQNRKKEFLSYFNQLHDYYGIDYRESSDYELKATEICIDFEYLLKYRDAIRQSSSEE